jgi:hypothetical protein
MNGMLRAKRLATSVAKAGALSTMLTGCHPFGCGSSRCVDERLYADMRRCNAVLEASQVIVGNAPPSPHAQFDSSVIDSQLIGGFDDMLFFGMKLGMSRDGVWKDRERAKNDYLHAYAARNGDHHEKLVALLHDVNECLPHSNPND